MPGAQSLRPMLRQAYLLGFLLLTPVSSTPQLAGKTAGHPSQKEIVPAMQESSAAILEFANNVDDAEKSTGVSDDQSLIISLTAQKYMVELSKDLSEFGSEESFSLVLNLDDLSRNAALDSAHVVGAGLAESQRGKMTNVRISTFTTCATRLAKSSDRLYKASEVMANIASRFIAEDKVRLKTLGIATHH